MEPYRESVMKILMIAENDPAGTAIAFTRAVNRLTPHSCRLVTTQTRYNHAWEKDLHIPDLGPEGLLELEELLKGSDVFHFHMVIDENYRLGPFLPKDYLAGKTVVHHHHGHPDFRAHPEKYQEKYRKLCRDKLLVSTPDLLRKLPEASWQPNLVPIDDPLYRPNGDTGNGKVRLSHSPTRKDLKNTDDLLHVCSRMGDLARDGRLELDVIDNEPHTECLRRKRESHVVFDHMQGYYGVSSLEGLSQGKPTIAGLDDWNQQQIRNFFQCEELPWIVARSRDELEGSIRSLVADPEARARAGENSRRFMEETWNESNVVNHLIQVYEQ